MNIYEKALNQHESWKGKIETKLKAEVKDKNDLSVAYTPGVAEPCRVIAKDKSKVYDLTWKSNTIAVVSDGTAVLGLGDIGPEAGLPVMEGKAVLFKQFADIDAIPICLDTKDPKEIISICKALAPSFGGINLEDISAPRCVEIERTLIEEMNIPVFHDDQHGTAIVCIAALHNALKLVGKKKEDITVVVSGAGAAGSSVAKMLIKYGVGNVLSFDINGIITKEKAQNCSNLLKELAEITNKNQIDISFKDAFAQADAFIGVSAPKLVSKDMVGSMKEKPIIFAMANPEPEITYDEAKEAGAYVVGTGRSDFPNQINNVLAFPGIFRGALDSRSEKITEDMKMAAAIGIASLVDDKELTNEYIIPSPFDNRVVDAVSKAVYDCAKKN